MLWVFVVSIAIFVVIPLVIIITGRGQEKIDCEAGSFLPPRSDCDEPYEPYEPYEFSEEMRMFRKTF